MVGKKTPQNNEKNTMSRASVDIIKDVLMHLKCIFHLWRVLNILIAHFQHIQYTENIYIVIMHNTAI